MTPWQEQTALLVDDEAFSVADLLRQAKWRGETGFVQAAADAALIRRAARERGIAVSDEELQRAADAFRAERELYAAADLHRWLGERGLGFADWERMLEEERIAEKLREALIDGEVERCFAERRLGFDAATISHLVARDRDAAAELRLQVVEEGADFHRLARRHSIDDETRPMGGFLGLVRRADLDAIAAAAVFGAEPGSVAGPLKDDAGWRLILIEARHPAVLDDATRDEIRALLFEEWLDARRGEARLRAPLLEIGETR